MFVFTAGVLIGGVLVTVVGAVPDIKRKLDCQDKTRETSSELNQFDQLNPN